VLSRLLPLWDVRAYVYTCLPQDASWNLATRSADGALQPDPKLWPSGMDATIDYVHSLGLKFGLYGDRGSKDCAGKPGADGHEVADAHFLAAHKVDWYKEDSCHADGSKDVAFAEYGRMRDALNATGYPTWFALCGWKTWYASDPRGGNTIGNSARVGPDTGAGESNHIL
jgi:alpha-galactosidase